MNASSPLLAALWLEALDDFLFRGTTPKPSLERIFGGQVMAQSVNAAARTAPPGRELHSFHAYFLRPGDPERPILFEVEPVRDGRTTSTRRVVAIQRGRAIYVASLSFMDQAPGFSHQEPMPPGTPPDEMETEEEYLARMARKYPGKFTTERLFPEWEIRWPRGFDPFEAAGRAPVLETWLRLRTRVPVDPLHSWTLLAYASDFGLVAAASLPHAIDPFRERIQMLSLDHGMWFHDLGDVNDWLYYRAESHWSGRGRGLNIGKIYQRDGRLLATTVQEGLMRLTQP